MDPTVLIVEDEAAIVTMLRYNLEREGMQVVEAGDGDEALKIMAETHVDLVLLDWMLPVMSGIEVCRQIRRKPESRDVPVIMVTARGEEGDRIRGLDTGADDYVTKPFAIGELLARRSGPAQPQGQLIYSDIEMDLAAHRVSRNGKAIHLGPTEFRLLRYFLEHPGRVFSREQLLNAVWGPNIYVETRTVDVHIRRLRKALNDVKGTRDIIRTVRAAGYALDSETAA